MLHILRVLLDVNSNTGWPAGTHHGCAFQLRYIAPVVNVGLRSRTSPLGSTSVYRSGSLLPRYSSPPHLPYATHTLDMATQSKQAGGPQQQSMLPQLSCELCHARKVKCDKLKPCTNCKSAGVACQPIHRKRLSRGRHVRNVAADRDLRERVQRLETLITDLGTNSSPSGSKFPPHLSDLVCSFVPQIFGGPLLSTRLTTTDQSSENSTSRNGTTSPSSISPSPKSARKDGERDGKTQPMAMEFWRDLVDNVGHFSYLGRDVLSLQCRYMVFRDSPKSPLTTKKASNTMERAR